jgi:hypothetical protein
LNAALRANQGTDAEGSAAARRPCVRAFVASVVLGLGACASPPRQDVPPAEPASFAAWRAPREADVQRFLGFLAQQKVRQVLPAHELLKSASSWAQCAAEPYALPPEAQWGAVVSVLRLLQALQGAGVLGEVQVHSGYRNPMLNACAGGATRSAHLLSFALDLTPLEGSPSIEALCRFWREQGPALRMGLGWYASGRLHIDTAGHRTWGGDGRTGSARCLREP